MLDREKSLAVRLGCLGMPEKLLPQRPSTWYLTGFLVPLEADETQRADEQSVDELDEVTEAQGSDDGATPEPAAARVRYLPSSIGVSLLVPAEAAARSTCSCVGATTRPGQPKTASREILSGSGPAARSRSWSSFLTRPTNPRNNQCRERRAWRLPYPSAR